MKPSIAILIAALILTPSTGSARLPEIVQLSPDTYLIIREDHGGIFGGSLTKEKLQTIKQANAFAASKGKVAIPLAAIEHPMGILGKWASFEYQFRVVDKDDPEARRTSLVQRPDVVVSVSREVPAVDSSRVSPPPAKPSTEGLPSEARVDAIYASVLKLDELRKRGLITDAE